MKPTLAIYGIKDRNNFEYPTNVHDHNLCLMQDGKILQYYADLFSSYSELFKKTLILFALMILSEIHMFRKMGKSVLKQIIPKNSLLMQYQLVDIINIRIGQAKNCIPIWFNMKLHTFVLTCLFQVAFRTILYWSRLMEVPRSVIMRLFCIKTDISRLLKTIGAIWDLLQSSLMTTPFLSKC